MEPNSRHPLARDILIIVLLAVMLSLVYNGFSPHGIDLIRVEPTKIAVPDSALFPEGTALPRQEHRAVNDTVGSAGTRVIAPLHEQALHTADSMKAAAAAKKQENVYRIITLEQFKRLRAGHRGILYDARAADDFKKSRIPGAKNIPGQEAENHFEDVADLQRDTLIVIYCNNPDCHLGRVLAEFLGALEFRNILLYDDGWDDWLKAKEPVDSTRISE